MDRIARWIALALALAIAVVTLGPISARPVTGASPDLERVFAFALLGGAIALGYSRHRDLVIAVLLAVALVAFLEMGQNFVPNRHGLMHDFMVKSLAVIAGAVAVWILSSASAKLRREVWCRRLRP